jgi:hypothetical protein
MRPRRYCKRSGRRGMRIYRAVRPTPTVMRGIASGPRAAYTGPRLTAGGRAPSPGGVRRAALEDQDRQRSLPPRRRTGHPSRFGRSAFNCVNFRRAVGYDVQTRCRVRCTRTQPRESASRSPSTDGFIYSRVNEKERFLAPNPIQNHGALGHLRSDGCVDSLHLRARAYGCGAWQCCRATRLARLCHGRHLEARA